MSDLVKQLRGKAFRTETYELVNSAADCIEKLEADLEVATMKRLLDSNRIEKLEAALKTVIHHCEDSYSSFSDIRDTARKALEGKNETIG